MTKKLKKNLTPLEEEQGKWMKSIWGKKFYFALNVVEYFKALGFTDTTPDETLPPGVKPVMVKDASVIALLAAAGLVMLKYTITGQMRVRGVNVPTLQLFKEFSLPVPPSVGAKSDVDDEQDLVLMDFNITGTMFVRDENVKIFLQLPEFKLVDPTEIESAFKRAANVEDTLAKIQAIRAACAE
jgi:hypothetical protein